MIHLWLFGRPFWETIGIVLLVIYATVCALMVAIVIYVEWTDLD